MDELKQRKQPKRMSAAEEEKGEALNHFRNHLNSHTTPKKVNAFATPGGSGMYSSLIGSSAFASGQQMSPDSQMKDIT